MCRARDTQWVLNSLSPHLTYTLGPPSADPRMEVTCEYTYRGKIKGKKGYYWSLGEFLPHISSKIQWLEPYSCF
jgi:hypothetical protein